MLHYFKKNMWTTFFPTQGQYSICLSATTSFSSYTKRSRNARATAAIKKFCVELFQTLPDKASISQINSNYVLLGAKTPAENEPQPTNQPPTTTCFTRKSDLMTDVHLLKVKVFHSLMVLVRGSIFPSRLLLHD